MIRYGVSMVCTLLVVGCGPDVPSSRSLEKLHQQAARTNEIPTFTEEEIDARLALLDEALAESPNDPERVAKRLEFALNYRPWAAVDQCLDILEKSPRHLHAMRHISAAYLSVGELDKALHYAGETLRVRPDADSRMLVAKVFEASGEREKAAQMYKRVLAKEKKHAGAQAALDALNL